MVGKLDQVLALARRCSHAVIRRINFRSLITCRYSFSLSFLITLISFTSAAQTSVSKVWVADNRDGTYRNPILYADYSDPDVVRVGDDFYLTASSFNSVPGLPILHSRDLVNWTIIGHVFSANLLSTFSASRSTATAPGHQRFDTITTSSIFFIRIRTTESTW